ncbi:uncharacterized protein LOC142559836 [Dermacentor variabilis]|uniref:uncharacterized protein LOC142559836 n=1 Tax=Dermacentor variabilis TaxID=34621 RepID=UPI003F5C8A5A
MNASASAKTAIFLSDFRLVRPNCIFYLVRAFSLFHLIVRKGHRSRLFRGPGALTQQGNVGGDADSNQAAALLFGGGDLPPAVAEDPPGSPSPLRLWLRCRRLCRPCGRYSAGYATCLRPVPVREHARRPGRRRHSGDRRRPQSIDLREDASRCGQRDDDANLPNALRLHGPLGPCRRREIEIYREQQPGTPQTAEAIYGWCCRFVAYADPVASTALASLLVFGPYQYPEAHALLAAVVMVVTQCVLAAATHLKSMVENDDGTVQASLLIEGASVTIFAFGRLFMGVAFKLHVSERPYWHSHIGIAELAVGPDGLTFWKAVNV